MNLSYSCLFLIIQLDPERMGLSVIFRQISDIITHGSDFWHFLIHLWHYYAWVRFMTFFDPFLSFLCMGQIYDIFRSIYDIITHGSDLCYFSTHFCHFYAWVRFMTFFDLFLTFLHITILERFSVKNSYTLNEWDYLSFLGQFLTFLRMT